MTDRPAFKPRMSAENQKKLREAQRRKFRDAEATRIALLRKLTHAVGECADAAKEK